MRANSPRPWQSKLTRNLVALLCYLASHSCAGKNESVAKGWYLNGQEVTSTHNQILPAGATLHLKDKFTLEAAVDSAVRISQLNDGRPQVQLLYGTAIVERLDSQFVIALLVGKNSIELKGSRFIMQSLNASTRVLLLAGALAVSREKNKWELSETGVNFFEEKADAVTTAKISSTEKVKIFPELARGKFLIAVQ